MACVLTFHWVRISVPAPTQNRFFQGPMGRCKVTTPSSFSLTSNRVIAKPLTYCPRHTAQLITGVSVPTTGVCYNSLL